MVKKRIEETNEEKMKKKNLGVLLKQLGEVLEQAVLRTQEVKLEVPLLPVNHHVVKIYM